MAKTYARWAAGVFALTLVANAQAQQTTGAASDSEMIAKATSAAPPSVGKNATVIAMNPDGSMRTLQKGTNSFTCMMLDPQSPMCADPNGMAWGAALMKHAAPPDAVGFIYMLGGDDGASNTDPYAKAKTASNHWVTTGPHVMIVGPGVKQMQGYPRTPDADPNKAYVMWAGTPYEHLMLPVSGSQP